MARGGRSSDAAVASGRPGRGDGCSRDQSVTRASMSHSRVVDPSMAALLVAAQRCSAEEGLGQAPRDRGLSHQVTREPGGETARSFQTGGARRERNPSVGSGSRPGSRAELLPDTR